MRRSVWRSRGDAGGAARPQVGEAEVVGGWAKDIAACGGDFSPVGWQAPAGVCGRFRLAYFRMAERLRAAKVGEFREQRFEYVAVFGREVHVPPAEEHGTGDGGEVVFVAGFFVGGIGFVLRASGSVIRLPVDGVCETDFARSDLRQLPAQRLNQ